MPDVKDLAQAAQGAAAAPESVNVVESTTSVNQPVQPTVADVPQTPQVDTANQSSAQVETINDVVKRICADGHSYVMTTVITNIDGQERTGSNGKSYLNAFVTIASPVKCAQSMPDGTHRMGMLGAIQIPFDQILLVMRKDKFYGRFVNYVGEAAETGFASMYLTGVAVKVLCQFVPAVRGGISPGGGLSLIKASTEIKSDVSYSAEREFRRATFSIFRQICENAYRDWETDRKSTRLNSSHSGESRMPSSA